MYSYFVSLFVFGRCCVFLFYRGRIEFGDIKVFVFEFNWLSLRFAIVIVLVILGLLGFTWNIGVYVWVEGVWCLG